MESLAITKVLAILSLRNLVSHKVKTLIVGWIIFFGTFLVVLGTTLLDSVERTMAKSITSSIAGHLQLYDARARDELSLFGSTMGALDIGKIPDFARVKEALSDTPNVSAIVPMAIDFATLMSPGELERSLGALRVAIRAGDLAAMAAISKQVRQVAVLLRAELEKARAISTDEARIDRGLGLLARVDADAFWAEFERRPLETLEYLDTEVAPLADEGKLVYLNYVGTDLDLFARHFDRFEIVAGEMVPAGHRGLLLNKGFYDKHIKNRVARELDAIRTEIVDQKKKVESDAALAAKISQLPRQYRRITFQLDPGESKRLEAALRAKLGRAAGGLEALLETYLAVDASNIEERHAFFYEVIAPMIELYEVPIGSTITLRGFTRTGYLEAVNVKIYGVFQFRGLEGSDLAGDHNLMDLMTFRDLYGFMTEDRRREIDAIRREVGAKAIARDAIERELFAGAAEVEVERGAAGAFDELAATDLATLAGRASAVETSTFTQAAIDHGVALSAAVVLEDPGKLEETEQALATLSEHEGLGVQVIDWRTASAMIGQFLTLIRIVLYVAIGIIFAVALVIINNSMVTATMERVTEIGTMRAIGAQRRFIMVMFLVETIVLGVVAGGLGALAGAAAIAVAHAVGIPAATNVLVFLFAGASLHPVIGANNVLVGLFAIVLVSVASTLYPARIATRIQPVVAMQRKE